MTHSFLIIGQSNMAGRGSLAEAEPVDNNNGKIRTFRMGLWRKMFRPVNPDSVDAGTSLVESFAKAYSEDHPDVDVGIIPAAFGGTCLDEWQEGGMLFSHAVSIAKLAMKDSSLKGILWHQGESDCMEERYPAYEEKLTAIMHALRRELGAEEIPLIVGGLGEFLKDYPGNTWLANYYHVNRALMHFAAQEPHTVFVSAEGLTSNPDVLHFNHRSLQAFGLRYYAAFKSLAEADCE